MKPKPLDRVFSWMALLASGSIAWGISKVITHMTVATKNLPRPSGPCFSARTVSPCLSDPMGRVSVSSGAYVAEFRGSCVRRAVLGPKQAAPISVPSSMGSSLGSIPMCWWGSRGIASPPVWAGSSTPCDLSVVAGLSSLEASSDGLPRRFRRLFLFLPPWRFLVLLVGPRGKGR